MFLNRPLSAQDEEDEARRRAAEEQQRQRQEEIRQAEELRQMQERSNRLMREFLNDEPLTPRQMDSRRNQERRNSFDRFRTSYSEFRPVISELNRSLDEKTEPRSAAAALEDCTKAFLDFIKRTSSERPRFDSSEFDDFTKTELGWEALTTAERIVPGLDALMKNENATTVDIKFLASLPDLELDILRLQWMSRQLK